MGCAFWIGGVFGFGSVFRAYTGMPAHGVIPGHARSGPVMLGHTRVFSQSLFPVTVFFSKTKCLIPSASSQVLNMVAVDRLACYSVNHSRFEKSRYGKNNMFDHTSEFEGVRQCPFAPRWRSPKFVKGGAATTLHNKSTAQECWFVP